MAWLTVPCSQVDPQCWRHEESVTARYEWLARSLLGILAQVGLPMAELLLGGAPKRASRAVRATNPGRTTCGRENIPA